MADVKSLPLFRQNVDETDISDSSEIDDIDKLGEKIFSLVVEMDPLHANDITGTEFTIKSATPLDIFIVWGFYQVLRTHKTNNMTFLQECFWRWTWQHSNSCSVTIRCWKPLFKKHKQCWTRRIEPSLTEEEKTSNIIIFISDL